MVSKDRGCPPETRLNVLGARIKLVLQGVLGCGPNPTLYCASGVGPLGFAGVTLILPP